MKSVPDSPPRQTGRDTPRCTRALLPFFNAEAVERLLTPQIKQIVADVVAEIAPLGRADLVPALGFKIPPLVLAATLGQPSEKAATIHMLTESHWVVWSDVPWVRWCRHTVASSRVVYESDLISGTGVS